MIYSFFFISIIYISLIGYSKLFKVVFLKNNEIKFTNLEIFYGILFLLFLSNFLNFFLPLKYFSIISIIIGVIIFIYYKFLNKIEIKNFYSIYLCLFFLIFISAHHSPNVDSEVYHLQIVNKAFSQKVIFGFGNLEEKYGMNSVWQIFLGLYNIEIYNFKIVYLVNLIPLSILLNQAYLKLNERNSISKNFLILSSSFILLYSFLHPSNNGIILNHLGSVEVDLLGGFLFILTIYIGLNLFENYSDNNFNILFILTAIVVLSKPSYLILSVFPIIISFIIKKNIFTKLNYLLLIFLLIFLTRGFITSGCFIFPAPLTCFDTFWSLDIEKVQIYENMILGFARDKMRYTDFDYLIYGNDWIIPWFKNYFLKTSLTQIFVIFVFLSLIMIIISYLKKKKIFSLNNNLIIFFLIISAIFWFRAPEVRFGFGWLISLSVIIPSIFMEVFKGKLKFNESYLKIFLILPLILILKNHENYYLLKENYSPSYNYEYKKVKEFNKQNIFQINSPYDRCVDIDEFCIYYDSKFGHKKIKSYNFFYKIKD